MEPFIVIGIIIFAVFVQSASGFGIALVAMPFLTTLLGFKVAAPLVGLVAFSVAIAMSIHYRRAFHLNQIGPMIAGSLLGIFCASALIMALPTLYQHENAIEMLLGMLILAYAAYDLLVPSLPRLDSGWGYGLGWVGGVLARLYNVGGPPAVMYAHARHWQPRTFKGNLQTYALINGMIVIAARALQGEFTPTVLGYYLLALPAVTVGLVGGYILDRYIKPSEFRKFILILLFLVGLQLLL